MKTIKLYLTECIAIGDTRRKLHNQQPVESIRGLGRELQKQWPDSYRASYITNRLHRAERKGIRKLPKDLIKDIATALHVEECHLLKHPPKQKGTVKRFCEPCNTLRSAFRISFTLISEV